MNSSRAPKWIFDPESPSGSRVGGDPGEYAFQQNLETFVREVLQNSNDNNDGSGPVEVKFAFKNLIGSGAIENFMEKMNWPELLPHLESVSKTGSETGERIGTFLKNLDKGDELLLLCVEDRCTTGLTGPESGEKSNFTALCRDRLYSYKEGDTSGGTYGLGKSVLWSFSGISTVLFSSILNEDPSGKSSPRFIGRSQLPWHRFEGEAFDGSGWFGTVGTHNEGERAESLWGDDADVLSENLLMGRPDVKGTSILIVGFRDPTTDEDLSPENLAHQVKKYAIKHFWPSMVGDGRLKVEVEVSHVR